MNLDDTDLNIRSETEQDKTFLESLYRSTRADLLQLGLTGTAIDNLIQMQFHAQQTGYRTQFPDAAYSIVEKNGVAIGYLIVDQGDKAFRLIYIALLPQERNRGYGRHLIKALQSQATLMHKPLRLSVDPQNMLAKHLYLASGFQVENGDGANLEMFWSGI